MDSWRFPGAEDVDEGNCVNYEVYDVEESSLASLQEKVDAVVSPFVQGYIWQCDAWNLIASEITMPPWRKGSDTTQGCLWGHQQFGDSVDEEWFVISLLMKITEHLPSVVARVWDNDGEVLLIEAAFHLPKWIRPETSPNRVWLRHGKLQIIPREVADPDGASGITVPSALDFFKSGAKAEAKEKIQSAIRMRLHNLPENTTQMQHWARCFLPVRAAHVLSEVPLVLSAAVEGFVDRDTSDMQALCHPTFFPPHDFVMSMIKFHRCSYAKLKQMEFHPPPGFQLPDIQDSNFNAVNIGMKVTCGMEILCGKRKRADSQNEAFLPPHLADKLQSVMEAAVSAEVFKERHQLFAEDDDGWLYDGRTDLEKELAKRQAEQQGMAHKDPSQSNPGYDPDDLIHSFGTFVDQVSSHEGAEAPQDVQFNTHRFLRELKTVLGQDFEDAFDDLDTSDFEDDDDSPSSLSAENESSDDASAHEGGSSPSSDSDDDSEFNAAYDEALHSELDQTKLPQSFIHKSPNAASLAEVDLDANLVQNLLQSHSDQQGLPGPVGTLAGLLHVTLPPSFPSKEK